MHPLIQSSEQSSHEYTLTLLMEGCGIHDPSSIANK